MSVQVLAATIDLGGMSDADMDIPGEVYFDLTTATTTADRTGNCWVWDYETKTLRFNYNVVYARVQYNMFKIPAGSTVDFDSDVSISNLDVDRGQTYGTTYSGTVKHHPMTPFVCEGDVVIKGRRKLDSDFATALFDVNGSVTCNAEICADMREDYVGNYFQQGVIDAVGDVNITGGSIYGGYSFYQDIYKNPTLTPIIRTKGKLTASNAELDSSIEAEKDITLENVNMSIKSYMRDVLSIAGKLTIKNSKVYVDAFDERFINDEVALAPLSAKGDVDIISSEVFLRKNNYLLNDTPGSQDGTAVKNATPCIESREGAVNADNSIIYATVKDNLTGDAVFTPNNSIVFIPKGKERVTSAYEYAFRELDGTVYGDYTLSSNLPSAMANFMDPVNNNTYLYSLTISEGASLTVPAGKTISFYDSNSEYDNFTNNGTLNILEGGKLDCYHTASNSGTINIAENAQFRLHTYKDWEASSSTLGGHTLLTNSGTINNRGTLTIACTLNNSGFIDNRNTIEVYPSEKLYLTNTNTIYNCGRNLPNHSLTGVFPRYHDGGSCGICTRCGKYRHNFTDTLNDYVSTCRNCYIGYESSSDTYIIDSASELSEFSKTVNGGSPYVNGRLAANIDMSGVDFQPIGYLNELSSGLLSGSEELSGVIYSGSFDGGKYTISNLSFNTDKKASIGLFGAVSGNISNVVLDNVTLTDDETVPSFCAGLAGYLYNGHIEDCTVKNSQINAHSHTAGALVGASHGGTVKKSIDFNNTVSANEKSGHTIGANSAENGLLSGTAEACFSDGAVTGELAGVTKDVHGSLGAPEFANGSVAYALNAAGGSVWGQNIGVDPVPVLNGTKIYKVTYIGDVEDIYYTNGDIKTYTCPDTGYKYTYQYTDFTTVTSFTTKADVTINVLKISDDVVASGTCGENLTWKLDSAGVLEISGTGDMATYSYSGNVAPWTDYASQITDIVMNEGITPISKYAFYGERNPYTNFTGTLVIPGSVKTIGDTAFYGQHFNGIIFGEGLETIEDNAFSSCKKISKDVVLPKSLKSLGYNFLGINSNKPVVIFKPGTNLTSMHANAFTRYSSYAGTIYNYSDSEIINNAYTVKTERYEVSDYSYSDGKATFKVSLGYKEMNTDSKILVAAYSADNTMLSCKVYDYDYVIYPTLEAEENSKIEVFWLDSFGNLKPIIESVSAH